MNIYRIIRRVGAFASLGLAHALASAQAAVTVTYGPATTVPTLSEWGLLIMSALLAAFAFFAIRKGASSKTIASVGVAIVVSFAAVDGTKLIKDVHAFVFTWTLTSPTGGQLLNVLASIDTPITNVTTVPLMIYSITPPEAIRSGPGACVPGVTILAPTQSCNVGIPANTG
jgi:hypothetical protein